MIPSIARDIGESELNTQWVRPVLSLSPVLRHCLGRIRIYTVVWMVGSVHLVILKLILHVAVYFSLAD